MACSSEYMKMPCHIGVEDQHCTTNGSIVEPLQYIQKCPHSATHSYPASDHKFHVTYCPKRICLFPPKSDEILDEGSNVDYQRRSPPPPAAIQCPSKANERTMQYIRDICHWREINRHSSVTQRTYPDSSIKFPNPSSHLYSSSMQPKNPSETQKLPYSCSKTINSTINETKPNQNLPSLSKGVNTQAIQKLALGHASAVDYQQRLLPPSVFDRPSEEEKRKMQLLLELYHWNKISNCSRVTQRTYSDSTIKFHNPSSHLSSASTQPQNHNETQKLPSFCSKIVNSTVNETKPNQKLCSVSKAVNTQTIQKLALGHASTVDYQHRSLPPSAASERPSKEEERKMQLLIELYHWNEINNCSRDIKRTYPGSSVEFHNSSSHLSSASTKPKNSSETQKLPCSCSKTIDHTVNETKPNSKQPNVSNGENTQAIQTVGLCHGKYQHIASSIFGDIDKALTDMTHSSCSNNVKDMNDCHFSPKQSVHKNPLFSDHDGFPLKGGGRGLLHVPEVKPSSCSNNIKAMNKFHFSPVQPVHPNPVFSDDDGFPLRGSGRGLLHVPEVKPSRWSNNVKAMKEFHFSPVHPVHQNPGSFHDDISVRGYGRELLRVPEVKPSSCSNNAKDMNEFNFRKIFSHCQSPVFSGDDSFPVWGCGRGVIDVPDLDFSNVSNSVKDTIDCHFSPKQPIHEDPGSFHDDDNTVRGSGSQYFEEQCWEVVKSVLSPLIEDGPFHDDNFTVQGCRAGVLHIPEMKPSSCSNNVKDMNEFHFSPKQPVCEDPGSFHDHDFPGSGHRREALHVPPVDEDLRSVHDDNFTVWDSGRGVLNAPEMKPSSCSNVNNMNVLNFVPLLPRHQNPAFYDDEDNFIVLGG